MTEGMDIVYLEGQERARFPNGLTQSVIRQLEKWAKWGNVRVTTIRDGIEIEAAYSYGGQLYWNDIGG